VYAGTESGGVYKSTNGGTKWSAINTGLTDTNVQALAINITGTDLYAGTFGGGVFKSSNTTSVFPDSVALGGGWKWSPWFGFYHDANPTFTGSQGWVYHLQHGWLYVPGNPGNGMFLWGQTTGWWWTSSTIYPFVYSFDRPGWLYYLLESTNPRWFYNYQLGQWENF
jgi:hypothetical protein